MSHFLEQGHRCNLLMKHLLKDGETQLQFLFIWAYYLFIYVGVIYSYMSYTHPQTHALHTPTLKFQTHSLHTPRAYSPVSFKHITIHPSEFQTHTLHTPTHQWVSNTHPSHHPLTSEFQTHITQPLHTPSNTPRHTTTGVCKFYPYIFTISLNSVSPKPKSYNLKPPLHTPSNTPLHAYLPESLTSSSIIYFTIPMNSLSLEIKYHNMTHPLHAPSNTPTHQRC